VSRLSIEVQGVVQGVGFRPFVYRIARARNLVGWVRNRPDGVEIEIQGHEALLDDFLRALQDEKPAPSRIHAISSHMIEEVPAESVFAIRSSGESAKTRPSVPADLALCRDCQTEMETPGERRYQYPFTNCTYCGPRYSIIAGLPYDRARTAMRTFPLCAACEAQYRDPSDRRFHAQPIACPACGPKVALKDARGVLRAVGEAALTAAAEDLKAGRVLAMKGLGGYQLLVDATSGPAIARLRTRKHREEKPFGVMFPDMEALSCACEVSEAEAAILQSTEAPILLLAWHGGGIAQGVAPGNPNLGAFLPYTPLHRLMLSLVERPLVCTSGNLSDEPMCIDDEEALERLAEVADAFLVHDRPVLRPVDDSVGRVEEGTLRLLRRARGFAPLPLPEMFDAPAVLAFGGHLKSTITLLVGGQAVVSQHLGDLDSLQGVSLLSRTVDDLLAFFQAEPARLACDLHPDYASTRLAERMSKARGLPLVRVQHHHAHVAASLAELDLRKPVLGLAWDGSGYGSDGTVWGGEALRVEGPRFTRLGHLRTFPLPGGERAVREPRRSALGLCWEMLRDDSAAADLFTAAELPALHRMLEQGLNSPRTSSVGRLFDAVTALVGIRAGTGFEGQAAMALEFAAAGSAGDGAYSITEKEGMADPTPLLQELLTDRSHGTDPALMARRFHAALADLVVAFAASAGLEDVILTGGCFQNRLLAALCTQKLFHRGFRVHRPALYPPNDGGISLGQAWVAAQWDEQGDLAPSTSDTPFTVSPVVPNARPSV
jgi:hydrogenase maturation protein HypF